MMMVFVILDELVINEVSANIDYRRPLTSGPPRNWRQKRFVGCAGHLRCRDRARCLLLQGSNCSSHGCSGSPPGDVHLGHIPALPAHVFSCVCSNSKIERNFSNV